MSVTIEQSRLARITARGSDLWRYRELIRNLVMSSLKSRYKNSALGFVWSLLNPLGMMLVFTIVFGFLMPDVRVEKYPLFVLTGLLPWNFFSASINAGLYSVVGSSNLVKKVYFPREVLPIASVLSQLINFLLAFAVLFVALIVFQASFSPWLWTLPFVILIQTVFSTGVVLILSTLNVFYRDTAMITEVVMLAWFFLTPVVYSVALLPETIQVMGVALPLQRLVYIFNPVASLIAIYRDLLYWGYRTDVDFFIRTALTALAVFAFGYWFFLRYSERFGEEL
ncbi:MAG: ABC transporter permease [Caldilinea sp.]|uniref:ABC transporter permease n=1 Tax=Caldilinea sp. TaxID=2293560 RepID=UPI002BAA6455|nr:ABC transporter permease [Caldilinea sp.]HRA64767.1 ABC transporter permease [Caldilinea sp.]